MIVNDYDAKTPFQAFALIRDGVDRRAGRPLRRRMSVTSCVAPGRRGRGELLRVRRADRGRGRGRAVRLPGSRTSSRSRARNAAARPGLKPARGPLGRARDAALNRVMARLFDKGLDRLKQVRSANGAAPVASVLEASSVPTGCCS